VVNLVLDGTFENIHSILLVKDGKLILEEYFPGETVFGQYINFRRNTLHNLHSVTKSFTSALIGIALDQGIIESVDQDLATFFPELADVFQGTAKTEIQLKHLLTMSSGLNWDEGTYPYTDSRNDHIQMDRSGDPVGFVLDRPLVAEPGSTFVYNSGLSITLGEIIFKVSGRRADEFAAEHLFQPLGIENFNWVRYSNGTIQAGGGLNLRPRDMAKFGQLFLNGGEWRGQRVISEEWVQDSTGPQGPNQGYGYQWWLTSFTINGQELATFSAQGRGGQFIFVFPALDFIAVFTGGNDNDRGAQPFAMLGLHILPALF
jgi:CubicO group peptidase (beta-lactamase class C family)